MSTELAGSYGVIIAVSRLDHILILDPIGIGHTVTSHTENLHSPHTAFHLRHDDVMMS